jgi:3-isopropylmalate dehydratase small subunit
MGADMQPFTTLTGIAAPLLRDDINTDQICPVMPLRVLDPDYGAQLFARWRRQGDGGEAFVLERPQFRAARILVVGRNFGCGSARESAAWAFESFGIRCIIARSFADLFRGNCLQNGILPLTLPDAVMSGLEAKVIETDGAAPFTVDLVTLRIACPDGETFSFEFDPADREALLEGLDEVSLALQNAPDIAAWEANCRQTHPWLQSLVRKFPSTKAPS